MDTQTASKPFAAKCLIALHFILGIGAVVGGLGLAADPGGQLMHMPGEFLHTSPFRNYLVPGLVLFLVLGVLPLWVAVGLIRKPSGRILEKLNLIPDRHWAWTFSLYTGFLLVGWITLQVYFIQRVGLVHVGYVFGALLILGLTLLPAVQRHYAAP